MRNKDLLAALTKLTPAELEDEFKVEIADNIPMRGDTSLYGCFTEFKKVTEYHEGIDTCIGDMYLS